MKGWRYVAVALLSIAIPLLCISISIHLSPWFNLPNNALSDLGHATRSPVAPIFNFGLSLGGFLIAFTAMMVFSEIRKSLAYLGILCSYTLILIAVFDEVYGSLHYWVSVAFFLSLGALLIDYIVIMKSIARKISATVALAIAIISWILHLVYGLPRGAAIPELISVFCVIPFYIDIVLQYTSSK